MMPGKVEKCLYMVCLVFFMMSGYAEGATEISVEARGLRIVGRGVGKKNDELRSFHWSEGTTLALLVIKPSGGLIGFDREKSELKSFVDDAGTDLLKKKKKAGMTFSFGNTPGFGMSPSISKDKKACLVEVNSERIPKKGSTAIITSGVLVFQTGSKTKDYKQDNVVLKKGTKVNAGPILFKITKSGKPQWGDAKMSVTLQAKKDLAAIKEIRFIDPGTKKTLSSPGGSSSMKFGSNITIEKSFNFKKKIDKATIVITYWTDMKLVSIPFKIKATVGL